MVPVFAGGLDFSLPVKKFFYDPIWKCVLPVICLGLTPSYSLSTIYCHMCNPPAQSAAQCASPRFWLQPLLSMSPIAGLWVPRPPTLQKLEDSRLSVQLQLNPPCSPSSSA